MGIHLTSSGSSRHTLGLADVTCAEKELPAKVRLLDVVHIRDVYQAPISCLLVRVLELATN